MTNPGYGPSLDRALYGDADDTVEPDAYGHEWFMPPQLPRRPIVRSPLMADVSGADTASWSSDARPPVTAWEGADMDAHWLDGQTWRHCRTGEAWEGEPVNLLDAVRALRSEPAGANISLNTVTDFMCAVIAASTSLDSLRAASGEEQSTMEAAE